MTSFFRPGEIPNTERGKAALHNTISAPQPTAVVERCKVCNLRIRGPNHAEGPHHRKVSLKK